MTGYLHIKIDNDLLLSCCRVDPKDPNSAYEDKYYADSTMTTLNTNFMYITGLIEFEKKLQSLALEVPEILHLIDQTEDGNKIINITFGVKVCNPTHQLKKLIPTIPQSDKFRIKIIDPAAEQKVKSFNELLQIP
jgi:hypothetical protein